MSDISIAPLAGRYRLVHPLGEGGMGRVWQARDELLGRDVAVKELAPGGLTAAELGDLRVRAIREARAIARIDQANVVRIFDVVHDETGTPWLVMELVRSRSLHQALADDGPLPAAEAARIGLDVLAALRAAHHAGILHRDVKPANVLLAWNGRVVLTDFGLAAVAGDSAMTRTGVVLGSPSYLAPERALDEEAGAAGDLWSLGATLYAAVEGRPPYEKSSPMATLAALMVEPPPPPRNAGALLPVLERLLQRDPRRRADADEAERLLRAVLASTPATGSASTGPTMAASLLTAAEPAVSEPAAPAPATSGPAAVTAPLTPAPDSGVPRRRTRLWWAVAAAVAVVAAVIGVRPLLAAEPAGGTAAPVEWRSPAADASSLPAAAPPSAAVPKRSVAASVSPSPRRPAPTRTAKPAATTTPPAPAATGAPTTQAAAPPPAGSQIRNHATGTCLDAPDLDGVLQMWQCQSGDTQRFLFASDGTLRVRGKCAETAGTGNGAQLRLATCSGAAAQQFVLNPANDLVSKKVDKCLDVPDSNAGNAVPVQIWDCAGTPNQKWN
ncbi:hypothetical protein Ade02nite_91060 [Paractinoplanes deccanensis]|uniref:non-specific serine/threonine protein kinase n=1 Tax=Paractinoplanes deccanensis TaxID=113561 RepID=A0ABQ3YKD4_9ACTN|nr:protein kinase [Actinoplanes deccanensis]GID80465.1 hypothetical protein Ade02nite_91060 [Actinoplanes deccanensis]